ncbi:hypothetical protein, partial [Pseudomonas sp. TMW22089]|uniref:hypothetical protein n=1 Tax=Pseudomonas sp. TMW22089 TaxID=2506433 RepID=UPI001F10BB19
LLTFACVLGISERHLLHRGSTVQFVGQAYFTRFGSPFQSFLKAKLIAERNKPGRRETHMYLGKNVSLNDEPIKTKKHDDTKAPNDSNAEKLFANADMDQNIKDALTKLKADKP